MRRGMIGTASWVVNAVARHGRRSGAHGWWRWLLAGLVALMILGTAPMAAGAELTGKPGPRLVADAGTARLERSQGEPVWLELGTLLVAGRHPLEIRARRASYDQPVVAHQVVGRGHTRREIRLPEGLVGDFLGLPAFTHVTVTDPSGAVVAEQDEPFCPAGSPAGARGGGPVRVDPSAPEYSPYPHGCPLHPFALGAVWGLQAGWGVPSTSPWYSQPVDLPDGAYTARVSITQPYRDLFGVRASNASVTVPFTVATTPGAASALPGRALPSPAAPNYRLRKPVEGTHASRGQHHVDGDPRVTQPARPATAGDQTARGHRWRPDLRALPAWAIWLDASQGTELLSFAATVWNAGTSPLVVHGTRVGTGLMDATQQFYDPAGHQVGTAPAGTFEWDPRAGHEHWHFTDFATYRLLDASGNEVAPSHKQAFCLANTDGIDTTIPAAPWQPAFGFDPGCGEADATTLHQRLDVGWGDNYWQSLPGQAIDVSSVPNGTYQLEIVVNPGGRLHETTTANNISRREVTLIGDPGERLALVPPYQGIDA
jgi:hypothetical protein